ncbi:ribosome maturation factor RimP [Cellvibrio zantedeschiae]|uniref:Ribosome maturation factor RimP n=1 Tax=Cellvibrio zantedeschiae TaxID=1237077 RepID=A0ABQ3BAM4_9GAMM|nr:ribosome maturation factor RimP [Cellvibrio zantedeschiae]GGY87086.1 ribosome maturation factor RimP [Cellvibrio zantedeschiae]
MASKQEILHSMIEPIVVSLGCELWGLEYLTQGRYTTLRLFIDAPAGVSLEDCEKVSRQVSSVMDVEDPIDGEYTLEVSSPGLDRPLYIPAHYARYVGETVNVRLRMARDGRRRFKGEIVKVDGDDVVITVEGKEILLPVDAIDKANVVPRYDEIISKIDGLKEKDSSK